MFLGGRRSQGSDGPTRTEQHLTVATAGLISETRFGVFKMARATWKSSLPLSIRGGSRPQAAAKRSSQEHWSFPGCH